MVKNPPANAGDVRDAGLIPGLRRSPGGGLGNPRQCSCLENPMDRGAWRAIVHNFSLNIICKNTESLCCTPENVMLL